MIPDLSNEAEMLKQGRLSALYRARGKCAEQARDMSARMLNDVGASATWDIEKLAGLFREIEQINLMIAEIKDTA
jgi:hypothetical protein